MVAVQNFHELKLAHLDIRLPNLCIGQNFDVVLIDVDMSNAYNRRPESYTYDSCLYHVPETLQATFDNSSLKSGVKLHYMQVGWMIAHIVNYTPDEHQRVWESQPKNIQENSFIKALVREFKYEDSMLSQLDDLGGSETPQAMITERSL